MQGYIVRQFGGPENMLWEKLSPLSPGPGQVLVKVFASGINFAETRMRAGTYGGQPIPFVMGMEGAGLVESVGAGVSGFEVGQRVFGRARGCHAQYVLFGEEHLLPLPDNLNFVQGAAIPVGWLTAWHALYTVAELADESRVLIEAVGGSVGSAAVQIAKQRNCWVAGTASKDEKLERAKEYGVDLCINYTTDSISKAVLRETDGLGANISLMTIGEATATELMASMGMDGKIVMFGSTGGRDISFNLNIGTMNLQLLAMSISSSPQFVPKTMKTFRQIALPLFASGDFKPVVDIVLPLQELERAHAMIEERRHYGKVIMEVSH